jgi:tRNA-dihydrouridine synthase B
VRTARKHIGWYVRALPGGETFRAGMNAIEECEAQWRAVSDYFEALAGRMERIPAHRDDAARDADDTDTDEEAAAAATQRA